MRGGLIEKVEFAKKALAQNQHRHGRSGIWVEG